MRKKLAVTAGAAALALALTVPAAAAGNGKAYGMKIKAETGMTYGQLLNSVRGDTETHGMVVFPPAEGAKAFYETHFTNAE